MESEKSNEKKIHRRELLGIAAAAISTAPLKLLGQDKQEASPDACSSLPEAFWEQVSRRIMVRPGVIHLNTGTQAPLLDSAYQALVQSELEMSQHLHSYLKRVKFEYDTKSKVRTRFASLVKAGAHEVALSAGVTESMATGIFALRMQPGDEIVYTNHCHSSVGNPVLLRAFREGLRVKVVDLSSPEIHPYRDPGVILNQVKKALSPRTRLLAFCHINYTDGCVMPVKEICELARNRGIVTCVDGAQGVGMLDVDLHALGCDMYVGAMYKWLMGPHALGFFYARSDIHDRIMPLIYRGPIDGKQMLGPMTDEDRHTLARFPGIAKLEMRGGLSFPAVDALSETLDFHFQVGPRKIQERVIYLSEYVAKKLRKIPGVDIMSSRVPSLRSGLVAFRVRGVPTTKLTALLDSKYNILIREITHSEVNWDVNRVSMHVFVTMAQTNKFLEAIEDIVRQSRSTNAKPPSRTG